MGCGRDSVGFSLLFPPMNHHSKKLPEGIENLGFGKHVQAKLVQWDFGKRGSRTKETRSSGVHSRGQASRLLVSDPLR